MSVRGVLQVHSAPPALSPHIEWAVAGVLGLPVNLPWVGQPAAPGMVRAELSWQGRPGFAAEITSALAAWARLRFEATEEASPGCDAMRFSYTPALGLFSAVTLANGDIAIPEGRLRAALTLAEAGAAPVPPAPLGTPIAPAGAPRVPAAAAARAAAGGTGDPGPARPGGEGMAGGVPASLPDVLARLLGRAWDDELEPFRWAADGAPVRWLHATG